VDPRSRTLEVLSLEASRWTAHATYESAAGVRAAPFEPIALELGALWG
jgi:hypothetical protein